MPPADRPSIDTLFSAVYEELRALAAAVRRGEASQTLNPTGLVNEAYLKLVSSNVIQPDSRLHLKRIAARAMRQVLVEAARRRTAEKRGGDAAFVTFDPDVAAAPRRAEELLSLHAALDRLAALHPRPASVVECRYFGGLEVSETARVLEVSEATVARDWRVARAWLAAALEPDLQKPSRTNDA